MRILVITGGSLPVPAVRGGAIETRVNYLIDENEKNGLWDLEVVSCCNEQAEEKSGEYKNTIFHYLENRPEWVRRSELWNRIVKKLIKDETIRAKLFYHPFLYKILEILKKRDDFDAVILENKPEWALKLKKVSKAPLFLHLGNDHLNASTKNASQIVACLDGILTVSEYISECVMTIPGARRDKIRRIQQGIDQQLFDLSQYTDEQKRKTKEKCHVNPDDVVFYFAGRIEREKGILELVKAFNRFQEKNVKLLIAGDVSIWTSSRAFYDEVMEEAASNKDKIIFLGSVAHDKIASIHAITDAAVLPSTWNEPSGNAMIECMVAGLPLITTESGGLPEYCPKGSAVLVPVTDHLEDDLYEQMHDLYLHPEKREQLRHAAKEKGKRYTTTEHYLQIHRAIQELGRSK